MISLSVILALTLALPVCCHADSMTSGHSHQSEMMVESSGHTHSSAHHCECGHDLAKDYQKTKKLANSQPQFFAPIFTLVDQSSSLLSSDFLVKPKIQLRLLRDSGPPIYLLVSVFLN